MDLPTYTSIWRIEKRLYKLYDFRLPMPVPVGQIAVFAAITVPYVILLTILGLPFNHTLFWLYVLPPGVITWLATRPVLESKRLPELVTSQVRYLGEPGTWCRMAPLAEKDDVVVIGKVWRRDAERPRSPAEAPALAPAAAPAVAPRPARVRPAAARKAAAAQARSAARATAATQATSAVRASSAGPQTRVPHAAPAPRLRRVVEERGGPAQWPAGARGPAGVKLPGAAAQPAPVVPHEEHPAPVRPASAPTGRHAASPGFTAGAPGQVEGDQEGLARQARPDSAVRPPGAAWPVKDPHLPAAPPAAATPAARGPASSPWALQVPPAPVPSSFGDAGRPAGQRPTADAILSALSVPAQAAPPAADTSTDPVTEAAAPAQVEGTEVTAAGVATAVGMAAAAPPAPSPPAPPVPGPAGFFIGPDRPEPVADHPTEPEAAAEDGAAEDKRSGDEPEAAEPELAEPEAELVEPEVAEPEPEAAEPEAAEPEVAGPEVAGPEAEAELAEPDVVEPQAEPVEDKVAEPEARSLEQPDEYEPEQDPPGEEAPPAAEPPSSPASPWSPPIVVVRDSSTTRPTMVERALSGPGQHRGGTNWREHVRVVPGGQGPGRPDMERRDRARVLLPVHGPRLVVVLGCTVGAGQTVTTLMLADVLASLRAEPVAALDLNPGQTSLTDLARTSPAGSARGLLTGSAPVVPGQRGRGRTDLIAHDSAPDGGPALADEEYARVIDILRSRYPLTLTDPGASAVSRVLSAADQLVLVAPASSDAARAVAMTMEWLDGHGYGELCSGAITVINGVSKRSMPHVEQAELVVRGRCRAIVRVPWDDHLGAPPTEQGISEAATDPESRFARLRPPVQQAYTALAGVLVSALAVGGATATPPGAPIPPDGAPRRWAAR